LSYDLPFAGRRSTPSEVVLISIGPKTLSTLSANSQGKLHRRHYARLLKRLSGAGHPMVVFDVLFPTPSEKPEEDEAFAQAIRDYTNVVLVAELDQSRHGNLAEQSRVEPILAILEDAATGWGLATALRDGDYSVRELLPGTNGYPALSWAAAGLLGATNLPEKLTDFPRAWLNYYGPPETTFLSYNLEDVVDEGGVPLTEFSNKVVMIGGRPSAGALRESRDAFNTPLGIAPGVEIHATTLVNLLRGDWLRRMNPWWERTVVLVAGLLLGAGLARLKPWHAAWVAALSVVVIMMAGRWSQLEHRIWFAWAIPAFAQVPVGLAWSVGFQYVNEAKMRWRLRRTMTPRWAKLIEEGRLTPKLGGVEKEVTVMFTDLEGFARFSEGLRPREMSALMAHYFGEMTKHVESTQGDVMKYMGDGLMAAWGALEPCTDHQIQAVTAAWWMSQAAKKKIVGRHFPTRIGLNTGTAMCGFVGAANHFEYSSVGTATNVASRLEQLNKSLGTGLLIGGETHRHLAGRFRTRALGRWRLRGLEQITVVFEVLGPIMEMREVPGWLPAFEEGLAAWTAGDFDRAREGFARADHEREGGDGPSKFFLKRLGALGSVPSAWDGVVNASAE
jgi:adenylate cyclase